MEKVSEMEEFATMGKDDILLELTTSQKSGDLFTKDDIALSKNGRTEEYVQKKISISAFQREKQEEIQKKAQELELICDLGYDVILVSGDKSQIATLIGYLWEIESEAKKALCPK